MVKGVPQQREEQKWDYSLCRRGNHQAVGNKKKVRKPRVWVSTLRFWD